MQVFDKGGITEAIDTAQGGGREPHVALPCFCDMTRGGGWTMTDNARCLQARYNKGSSNHSAEVSGVAVPFFVDLTANNGIQETEDARCLQGRYQHGFNERKADKSGIAIPVLTPDRAEKRQNGRRFKENGDPAFTLTAQDRHGVAIKVKEATKQGYAEAKVGDSINLEMPESKTRRGRVGDGIANTLDTSCSQGVVVEVKGTRGGLQEHQTVRDDGISPALTAAMGMGGGYTPVVEIGVETDADERDGIYVQMSEDVTVYAIWYEKYQCYIAIRKLTPKECFRLQGWTDDYFDKAQFVNSDSQLYKQAGNGVTVSVIQAIAEKLKEREAET